MRFILLSVFDYFQKSSLVKWIVDCNLCVFFENCEGRSLFVFIRKSCFAKKIVEYFSIFFKVGDKFIIIQYKVLFYY